MVLEQAIFSSAVTHRARGYQLVACSPGVCDADARELTVWCPTHDALLEEGRWAQSVNFHPLESGHYCVSRTTSASAEYSDRGAVCVTTHCLIVEPDLLRRFANNPQAVLRAAIAGGAMDVGDPIPEHLKSIELPGRAPVVDWVTLTQTANLIGIEPMAELLRTALAADSLGLIAGAEADRILAALLACLPIDLRKEVSFSTGLKYSPRRPFRWVGASGERNERRRLENQFGVTVVEIDTSGEAQSPKDKAPPEHGWSGYVATCIRLKRLDHLAVQLEVARPGLTLAELEKSGDHLMCELLADVATSPAPAHQSAVSRVVHAHASHERAKIYVPEDSPPRGLETPSQIISLDAPEVVEQLETLDDAVYNAISGDAESLAALETLWPEVLDRLGYELVEPSREQYLQYALSIWLDFSGHGAGGPEMAAAALDVLEVLCLE